MRNGIIGSGNWIYDNVKTLDRWPGEGNLCNILSMMRAPGGGPTNVLFDLAAMDKNLPLYASGLLGKDEPGDWLLDEIRKRNIDTRYLRQLENVSTSFTDVMSAEGKRTFFHCRGANDRLDYSDFENIDVPAKFFYLGYLLLLAKMDSADPQYGTVAARVLDLMRRKGYKTIVDLVSEAPERFRSVVIPSLPYIDIMFINEVELGILSGIPLRSDDGKLLARNLPAAVDFMFDKGVKETVIVHFPEGAGARSADGKYMYVPAPRIASSDIVGTNGAGDAFAAGAIYGLHAGQSLEDSLRLGGASSHFNLLCASASGGAVPLEKMQAFLADCEYYSIPE